MYVNGLRVGIHEAPMKLNFGESVFHKGIHETHKCFKHKALSHEVWVCVWLLLLSSKVSKVLNCTDKDQSG